MTKDVSDQDSFFLGDKGNKEKTNENYVLFSE